MVYLSGGNTFFRMDKFCSTGIEQALVEHVEADKILVENQQDRLFVLETFPTSSQWIVFRMITFSQTIRVEDSSISM